MAILFKFSTRERRFYAQVNEAPPFYLGTKVSYGRNWGIMNIGDRTAPQYDPDEYRAVYGIWSDFITPIAGCEGRRFFTCVNTYDRARFSFGFLQYAAHVPNGDFVKYLRQVLVSPEAGDYFPDLKIEGNHIVREFEGESIELETNESTEKLQEYLNPSLAAIDYRELVNAARFIHLLRSHENQQELAVEVGIKHLKDKLSGYSRIYNLDGWPDYVCLVVCDIRHQGRARSSEIIEALDTRGNYEKAFNNLLRLGAFVYTNRSKTLRTTINRMRNEGILGRKVYRQEIGDFV